MFLKCFVLYFNVALKYHGFCKAETFDTVSSPASFAVTLTIGQFAAVIVGCLLAGFVAAAAAFILFWCFYAKHVPDIKCFLGSLPVSKLPICGINQKDPYKPERFEDNDNVALEIVGPQQEKCSKELLHTTTVVKLRKTVHLNSSCLGFSIQSSPDDGVIIKDVAKSVKKSGLSAGDCINSIKIFFENVVYEDALTILNYSAPYSIELEVTKTVSSNKQLVDHQKNNPTVFSKIKSQSIDSNLHKISPLSLTTKFVRSEENLRPKMDNKFDDEICINQHQYDKLHDFHTKLIIQNQELSKILGIDFPDPPNLCKLKITDY